jgi:hypothetical protein
MTIKMMDDDEVVDEDEPIDGPTGDALQHLEQALGALADMESAVFQQRWSTVSVSRRDAVEHVRRAATILREESSERTPFPLASLAVLPPPDPRERLPDLPSEFDCREEYERVMRGRRPR